jgi:hypothetical protein
MTQNNLGIAYSELPTGDPGANLQQAIRCFEAAVRGFESSGMAAEADPIRRILDQLR